ncbi:hypothetical protein EDB89DRAFT_2061560 [Lactarius sanguifluus]|nr:hypothetical protein EDB89DRAFT_2061560 [Lactarius sanguifluus]
MDSAPYTAEPISLQTRTDFGSVQHPHALSNLHPQQRSTDPAPATTFTHLDATTVLSCSISELGVYPTVNPLDSKS